MFYGLYPFAINTIFSQNPSVAFPEQYTLLETVGVLCKTLEEQKTKIEDLEKRIEKLEK